MQLRPAEGERRAVRGYSAQYRVAAQLIYAALVDGNLEWVRIADPDAGRVDDVQIGRRDRVDAYQVKWGEYEERITFKALVSAANHDVNPAPFTQLAEGWRSLSTRYPGQAVHVHFVTRASPSTSDNVGGPLSNRTASHLQAFLRHAFSQRRVWSSPDGIDIRNDWSAPIAAIRGAVDLGEVEFAAFIQLAHLDLGFRLADEHDDITSDRSDHRKLADLDHLASFLFRSVADERRTIKLSAAELIRALGWQRRLDLRFRHEFPVDECLYRPIRSTVSAIENALATFLSGYIALVGPPGSGKSTTLTQMLRYRPGYRVVRYYAFVRGDTAQGRGEAEAFLSDLTVALRRSGVDILGQRGMLPETRTELQNALGRQLAALHEDWKEHGIATLILIDGLDHIKREQRPQHPLFEVLPSPTDIPEGMLFVLGSQRVGLQGVGPRIQAQLGEPGRTLTMDRLERSEVVGITAAALQDEAMSELDLDTIWKLSAGHPLALSYLLKRLNLAAVREARQAVLTATQPFEGDVEQDYAVYWSELRADPEVRHLLGMLCRIRGAIDLGLLSKLTSEAVLERFVASAAHYFHQETANRWSFFHNSFKQYLIVQTGRDALGRLASDRDRDYHHRLANAAADVASSPFAWERLFHLFAAGQAAAVLQMFTQKYFREQFLALRPLHEIQDDIALCLKAAVAEDDRIAFIRALLIEQELKERHEALKDVDLPELLLRLADRDKVADAAINDGELRVPEKTAMEYAEALLLEGDTALAHRLFDLAEPSEWLSGSRPITKRYEREHVQSWIRVAWRFRPLDMVFRLIGQVRTGKQQDSSTLVNEEVEDDDEHDSVSNRPTVALLETLAIAALYAGQDDIVTQVEAELRKEGGGRSELALARFDYLRAEGAIRGERSHHEGRLALERACTFWRPDQSDPESAMTMALALLKLGGPREQIEAYVGVTPSPLLRDPEFRERDKDLRSFSPLIRQARVLAALGRPLDPVVSVPDSARPHRQGVVLFQRMLILIASVRGEADGGRRLTAGEVIRRLMPALKLFHRRWDDVREWTDWHTIRSRAESYFDFILQTAFAHGQDAFDATLREVASYWKTEAAGSNYWSAGWRRAVLRSALALDGNRDRSRIGLAQLDEGGKVWNELHDRVDHHAQQLKAWLELSEHEKARAELAALLRTSFGIYHDDDDQYKRWAEWAARAAAGFVRSQIESAINPLVRGLVVVYSARRGQDSDIAASTLLEVAGSADPNWCLGLVRWLLQHKGVSREAAIAGLLRGALRNKNSSRVATAAFLGAARLAAPFETAPDKALVRALGSAAVLDKTASGAPTRLDRSVRTLLRVIATKVYPQNRSVWQDEFARAIRNAGGDYTKFDLVVGEPSMEGDPVGVRLVTGDFVPLPDILRRYAKPSEFVALMASAESADRIPWSTVLETVLHGAQLPSYKAVHASLDHLNPPLHVECWFAKKFTELGASDDAHIAVSRAWDKSKPYGWIRNYDGGTRLIAAEAAILLDAQRGQRDVFQRLVRDYLSDIRHPSEILRNLERIVALLFTEPPIDAIWLEIAEHVGQLAEVRAVVTPDPPKAGGGIGTEPTVALIDFALDELSHAVPDIATEARKFLLDLLADSDNHQALHERVALLLAGDDDARQATGLTFLICALKVDEAWVASFGDVIADLVVQSPSSIIRREAENLLECLDRSPPARPTQQLPIRYRLQLPVPAMPNVSLFDELRPGQVLNDTADPTELTRAFDLPLARLAEMSGIPLQNLTARMAAMMPEIAPVQTWNRAAELRQRELQDSAGLKIAYRRLRTAIAHRAFARVVQELTDAGEIPWPPPGVEDWLFLIDPLVSTLDPIPRPEWLILPEGRMMNAYPDKDWTRRPDDSLAQAPFRLPDGSLVVSAALRPFFRCDGRMCLDVLGLGCSSYRYG